jgi:lysophospholipase L1-like esterase
VVLAIGSSTTAGVGGGGAGYAQLLGPLLSARASKTFRVIVSGSLGETASGAAARLAGEIAMHKPDLVVWQVGTNDANFGVGTASFRQTLASGLASIKNAGVDAVLVDPQFSNWAERGGSATDAIAAVVAEEGQRRGVPVARRFQAMKRLAASDRPAFDRLISWDGLHLSPEGHACMAEQVAGTILRTVAR